MSVDESTVYSTGHRSGVFGDQFGMGRVRHVVESDTILSIRRALTRDHQNLAVSRRHDVVDYPRVNFDRVSKFGMGGIGNVVHQKAIRNRRVVRIVPDDPFFGTLELLKRRPADDLDFAFKIAW